MLWCLGFDTDILARARPFSHSNSIFYIHLIYRNELRNLSWKTAPRDSFIGWSPAQRQRNLPLVLNNARFLIVPWIRIPNLASHLLAQLQRRLPHDWQRRYTLRPVLLETFCETPRFLATCYQSANWLCVGQTQGRGKLDVHRQVSVRSGGDSRPVRHRLSTRFQSRRSALSQMSFFGLSNFLSVSYRPRPWVVPTRVQPEAR